MSKKESTGKSTETEVGTLVPQEHGGALRYGGTSKGGTGRPASKVREAARAAFSERLHILEGMADNEDERTTDRIAALKLLADTGGVDKIALTFEEQPETAMTPERLADLLGQIHRIKTVTQLEKLLVGAVKKQARE